MQRPHFVTGKLAAHALRNLLVELMPQVGIANYTVEVLPISVAALMTVDWIAKQIHVPSGSSCVILPGYCEPAGGDLTLLTTQLGIPVHTGPRDLRSLPEYFGQQAHSPRDGYGAYDIEIIAEINHAPRLEIQEILRVAANLKTSGADVIDVGCDPSQTWSAVGDCVRALRDGGFRVSIDSMNHEEISVAAKAGAELVLSVNSSNREFAADWGCEVVVVPDDPRTLVGLDESIEFLRRHHVPFRVDPILEPIAFGFADSLGRYLEVRRRYPDVEVMMGIGNLTELTDCDSAAINVLLLGICQEISVRSILTTEVINWARSSVSECDLARRLMHYAVRHHQLPKHIEPSLVMLRDPRLYPQGIDFFRQLAVEIRDPNYRLFAEEGEVHAITKQWYASDGDPFLLFERMMAENPNGITAPHAFYLGYEMCKAVTALTLGKQYRQDESLDWGLLTTPEESHRLKRTTRARK